MSANTDSPAARILGGSLRRARNATGMSLRDLADQLGVSFTAISHWETAQRVPRIEDVASFLTGVGVTGAERDTILQMARDAVTPNYLTVGATGITKRMLGVMECERSAALICDWSPLLIPGLFQTGDYAREILGASNVEQVDAQVALRLDRLNTILNRPEKPTVDVLIGEAALRHYRIGGHEIMVRQLVSLVHDARRPGVALRVVPASAGWHPGLMGPFVLYEFATAPAIAHLEHYRSGVFLFNEEDVQEYKIAADTIRERALPPASSVQLIADIADDLEKSA